jgi:hypothetical protein
MAVTLLSLDGCANRDLAHRRLLAALAAVGRADEPIRHVVVETPEEATRLGFIGSPTILVDGRDPFATGEERPALACRLYVTPEGLAGSPTVDQLVAVLS